METRVGIIGAGASGMMAAIAAAEHGAKVTLLEHSDRIGKKILVTGNGKCNLTNLNVSKDDYRGNHPCFVVPILEEFGIQDTLTFFEKKGLFWKEREGYVYPISGQASTVLDLLRYTLEQCKVHVVTECKIKNIQKKQDFLVQTESGNYSFDRLILATGGKAAPKTGSDGSGFLFAKTFGHTVIRPFPALVQLRCQETYFKSISGIRTDAVLTLSLNGKIHSVEEGELQITDYGISGIPTFQLSRYAAEGLDKKLKVSVGIDLFPQFSGDRLLALLLERKMQCSGTTDLERFMTGMLNKKLNFFVLKQCGLLPSATISSLREQDIQKITVFLKNWNVTITETNSMDQAQISAGGVDTLELKSTLESKIVEGLYFAGEILDIDGRCGGYNLQWAWSSGYVAGKHAACETI